MLCLTLQVDVNWSVGTQGFTPELRPASNQPAAAVFVHREHSDVHYIENNANTCTPRSEHVDIIMIIYSELITNFLASPYSGGIGGFNCSGNLHPIAAQ